MHLAASIVTLAAEAEHHGNVMLETLPIAFIAVADLRCARARDGLVHERRAPPRRPGRAQRRDARTERVITFVGARSHRGDGRDVRSHPSRPPGGRERSRRRASASTRSSSFRPGQPWHKNDVSAAQERYEMTVIATASNPRLHRQPGGHRPHGCDLHRRYPARSAERASRGRALLHHGRRCDRADRGLARS